MKQSYFEKHNVNPWYEPNIAWIFEKEKEKTLVPDIEPDDIEVGDQFYLFIENKWVLITITYIRSEVIFYTIENEEKESWFPFGSIVFAGNLAYKEFIVPVAPKNCKQWIFKSICSKTVIRYE